MKRFLFVCALALIGIALLPSPAWSTPYTVSIIQQNGNVVATGSGSLNLSGLLFIGSEFGSEHGVTSFLYPSAPQFGTGTFPLSPTLVDDVYAGTGFGPANFGTGMRTAATTSSGNVVWLNYGASLNSLYLNVPIGYVSDNALSNSATWNNATFASLGVTPGTYVWAWGDGADQRVTLDILGTSSGTPSNGAVPEPPSIALFGAGLIGLSLLLRRRKNSAAVHQADSA